MNPLNCPQIRPIEKYLTLMKGKLRKKDGGSEDVIKFKKNWVNLSKIIDGTVVQNLMKNTKKKVRELARSTKNEINEISYGLNGVGINIKCLFPFFKDKR